MFTTRILPPYEWNRLEGTEPGKAIHVFDTDSTNIMVIETGDRIVGSWTLLPYYHAECVWVAEDYRGKPAVAKRLVLGMKAMAKILNVKNVITSAMNEDVVKLIKHFDSEKLPGEHYAIHFWR